MVYGNDIEKKGKWISFIQGEETEIDKYKFLSS